MSSVNSTNLKYSITDVVIVGAGPSGLMAAQALGRLGIDVTLVERRGLGEAYGNADGLVPRTMEIWQTYGMLEPFEAIGNPMIGMVAYEVSKDDGALVRSRPSKNVVVSSRFPYELTGSTASIEGTLKKNADDASVKFIQPAWPVSLDIIEEADGEYPVKVVFQSFQFNALSFVHWLHINFCSCANTQERNLEVLSAKYAIGADGAYSWIRRTLDIDMEGEQTEDVWGVVDVHLKTDFPDTRFKCIVQAGSGPLIIIPREDDKIRIYIQMSTADRIPRREDGRLDKTAFKHSDMLEKILLRLLPFNVEFEQVYWSTIFATAQKVAARFSSKNRVFIVGDACHTHSPKAGQGANASMGDAHNLGRSKIIAYVVKGWAKPSILDSYEEERRQYAQALISFDKEISTSLIEDRPAAEYRHSPGNANWLVISGIGISYATSNLTLPQTKQYDEVVAGERFPFGPIVRLADWRAFDAQDLVPSDGKFKLIVLPGNLQNPKSKAALLDFASGYQNAIQKSGMDTEDSTKTRLSTFTVARNAKEDILWTDIPSELVENWRS
ncbi:hypothetical protein BDN70DRAFT_983614 [Pholiota conissans]|uniref:FAD-binding domain-containing protein n=1 Tax=Pholiota conissans TaxID=109636 RepID=A0A9P6D0Q4_9AGAR|nr:hypothetical protein BDN70DRAFT_983614 [Pholiota conissans]